MDVTVSKDKFYKVVILPCTASPGVNEKNNVQLIWLLRIKRKSVYRLRNCCIFLFSFFFLKKEMELLLEEVITWFYFFWFVRSILQNLTSLFWTTVRDTFKRKCRILKNTKDLEPARQLIITFSFHIIFLGLLEKKNAIKDKHLSLLWEWTRGKPMRSQPVMESRSSWSLPCTCYAINYIAK